MTLTTERLKDLTFHCSKLIFPASHEEAAAMARELLANREAQPVAYAVFADNGNIRIWSADKGITENVGVPVPLYTAPPAPAVPEKCPEHVRSLMNIHADDLFDDADAQEIWNACRAAMLAQPVSSGYKLPPHVYRELVNSLRDTAVKFSGSEQLRERLNTALSQFIEPDHHHMRTAATKEND